MLKLDFPRSQINFGPKNARISRIDQKVFGYFCDISMRVKFFAYTCHKNQGEKSDRT